MRSSKGVWRAENLTKARPHVLVVASGVGLNVFRSQSTQPKAGSGGATHEEEEVRPRDALEENLLFCGFCSQGSAGRTPHGRWEHQAPSSLVGLVAT